MDQREKNSGNQGVKTERKNEGGENELGRGSQIERRGLGETTGQDTAQASLQRPQGHSHR